MGNFVLGDIESAILFLRRLGNDTIDLETGHGELHSLGNEIGLRWSGFCR